MRSFHRSDYVELMKERRGIEDRGARNEVGVYCEPRNLNDLGQQTTGQTVNVVNVNGCA